LEEDGNITIQTLQLHPLRAIIIKELCAYNASGLINYTSCAPPYANLTVGRYKSNPVAP
jgi:hypothetical protein